MSASIPDFIEGQSPREIISTAVDKVTSEERFLTPVEYGDCLRALRKLRGLTLGGLADMLGIAASTVSALELGRLPPKCRCSGGFVCTPCLEKREEKQ